MSPIVYNNYPVFEWKNQVTFLTRFAGLLTWDKWVFSPKLPTVRTYQFLKVRRVNIESTCIQRHLNARETMYRLLLVVIWLYEQLVNFKCFICTPKVRSFIILLTTDLLELINHDVSWSSMLLRVIVELSSLMIAGLEWSCTKQGRVHHLWRGNESSWLVFLVLLVLT